MNNKSILSLIFGLIIFGVLAVSVYRTRPEPNAAPQTGPQTNAKSRSQKDVAYGSVRLPETVSRLAVEGEKGFIEIRPENATGQLPVGEYYSRLWRSERKDDRGNMWALTGQIFDNRGFFKVHDSNQAELDLGEPIIASVQARKSGSIYSFNQIIKGRLDEHIELTRNGARPRAPKLNITNEDGTYDRTFSFEYG